MNNASENHFDVAIIGGGAAGLATAIFISRLMTARGCPALKIAILDGAKQLGAKILISGGGRCNVTNVNVSAKDFCGGSSAFVKRILKAFTVAETIAFFEELGVSLHEEEHGKLFPDSNKARSVLDAMLQTAQRFKVQILTEHRVLAIHRDQDIYRLETEQQCVTTRSVVLATGGKSVPKTGSDGFGYQIARSLGHSLLPQFPALVPLLLDGTFHETLSGVSLPVEITLSATCAKPTRFQGALLWTHFGMSGPVVLDVSRHWHAAQLDHLSPRMTANFLLGETFQSLEERMIHKTKTAPATSVRKFLAEQLPNRFVDSLFVEINIPASTTFAQLTRDARRALIHQLLERPLPVTDSRGFRFAEVTAGGIPLTEVNPSTMESRCSPNLFLVGEVLNVDGRLGGYNFQWAWSSAAVAAEGICAICSNP